MEHHSVYRVRLEGRMGLPETIEKLSPEGYFLQPMVSRDGTEAVFWGREAGETGFNIWKWHCAAERPVKLTNMEAVSGHPFWSADDRQIVFFSTWGLSRETEWRMADQFNLDRSPRNIWIMGEGGEDPARLTEGPHIDERPCISPDGKHVVFVSNRSGRMNLWSVSTRTRRLTQLTDHGGLDYRPVFSADGGRLAFFSTNNPQGIHDLCVMAWPDGDFTFPLAEGTFKWVHGPFWLSDGESLIVHGVRKGEKDCAIWTVNLDSQRIERVELPGVSSWGHGTLDASESVLVFDSRLELSLPLAPM